MKMSSHCGHVDIASTYSNRYGGTAICPPRLRGSCTARHSSCCSTARSGVGQMSCRTSRARRRKCVSNVLGPHCLAWAARVHCVGPLQRDFLGAVERCVYRLDALREAVILVRHLVFPRAESAAAVYVSRPKHILNSVETAVSIERWHGISVLEARVPGVVHLAFR